MKTDDLIMSIVSGALACFMCIMITWLLSDLSWRQTCIDRGIAQYNPETSQWEWKVDK